MTVPGHAYEALRALFDGEGGRDYLGEQVTMAQHMLQAGAAARRAGAPRALIVAAVVHDVGHFTGVVTGRHLMRGSDDHHDEGAASWLRGWFDEPVTEPVRLHVLAKRYLCAVDPAYHDRLSDASKFTLEVQGGAMSAQEADEFERRPYARAAVALRRWDDEGKDPHAAWLSLEQFRDDIDAADRTLTTPAARRAP